MTKRMSEGLTDISEPIKDLLKNNPFGLAPLKREGDYVMEQYGYTREEIEAMPKPKHKTTWIEFSIREDWEEECWAMIEQWLADKKESEDE